MEHHSSNRERHLSFKEPLLVFSKPRSSTRRALPPRPERRPRRRTVRSRTAPRRSHLLKRKGRRFVTRERTFLWRRSPEEASLVGWAPPPHSSIPSAASRARNLARI